MATAVNRWTIRSADGRLVEAWFDQDYTVLGLNPDPHAQPDPATIDFTIWNLGNLQVAIQCPGYGGAYASARFGDYGGQIQFQAPGSGDLISLVQGDEIYELILVGGNQFVIYSTTWNSFVTINSQPNKKAQNCNPLTTAGPVTDIALAERFSAVGIDRNIVFDFLDIYQSAGGLSFAGVDLSGHEFPPGTNLSQSTFQGVVSLNGCIMSGAKMGGASFAGVDLTGLQLDSADLTYGDFSRCDLTTLTAWRTPPVLTNAELWAATLPASMNGAHLEHSDLTGSTLSSCHFAGAHLANANLRGAIITGANFAGADLTGALMDHLTYTDVVFDDKDCGGAVLDGADLTGSNMAGVSLDNVSLKGTCLAWIDLTDTTFSIPMIKSTDPTLPTVFSRSVLRFESLGLDWSNVDLSDAVIRDVPADLSGLNATSARLPGFSFAGKTLDQALFSGADLLGANFSGLAITGAHFDGAILSDATFADTTLTGVYFNASPLGGVSEVEAPNFAAATLINCSFAGANVYGATFAGATFLGDNHLAGSTLTESDFSNTYLAGADLSAAHLEGATFDGAFLVQCQLDSAHLGPTRDGAKAASMTAACLQSVDFTATDLSGANLTDAALTASAGVIQVAFYVSGNLTAAPLNYAAKPLPTAGAFSDDTVCPNGSPYVNNVQAGLDIAQMMMSSRAPTAWTQQGRR